MSKKKIQMACGDVVFMTPEEARECWSIPAHDEHMTKKEYERLLFCTPEPEEPQKPLTGRTLRNDQLNKEHEL